MTITETPTAPTLSNYLGDTLPYHDSAPVRIEVAEDGSTLTVIWVEDLAWHHETFPEIMKPLTDEEGFLSDEAANAAATLIQNHLSTDAEVLHDDGEEYDAASAAFSVQYTMPNGAETTEEAAHDIAWDFTAAMLNLTDPGTFGVVYLFRSVAHELVGR